MSVDLWKKTKETEKHFVSEDFDLKAMGCIKKGKQTHIYFILQSLRTCIRQITDKGIQTS